MVGVGVSGSRIASSKIAGGEAVAALLDSRAEKLTELFNNPIIPMNH